MISNLELSQKPFIELQIEELIKENRIKSKRVKKFILQLQERLLNIREIQYQTINLDEVKQPILKRPGLTSSEQSVHLNFLPPTKLDVVGGFKTCTSLNCVDLVVYLPDRCIESKDVKNQRYHRKRAMYLAILARILSGKSGDGLIEKLEFKFHQGDFLKPVLVITPFDTKLKKSASFQLFAVPPENCHIKLSLLNPDHGNISPRWFFEHFALDNSDSDVREFLVSDSDVSISPYYNSSILHDIEMVSNSSTIYDQIKDESSIREALILTKIWLMQRELNNHFSFIMSMFVAYLQTKQIIHRNMSVYQIFKTIIKSLTSTDWIGEGLCYFEDAKEKIKSFQSVFPVVFLSPSGSLNLCFNVTSDLYDRLKQEANISWSILNCNSPDSFEFMFLKKLDFITKFDAIAHLPKCTQRIPKTLEMLKKSMDYGIFAPRIYSERILQNIKRGLTDRVRLVQQSFNHFLLNRKWSHKAKAFDPTNEDGTFTFGLLVDPEKSLRIIDIGPEGQTDEAEDFRKFWEPKSELRLQNGVISETVVWHVDSFSKRRAIIKFILTHSLKRVNITNVILHYTTLERFITLNNVNFQWRDEANNSVENVPQKRKRESSSHGKALAVGEEVFQRCLHGYNQLNKVLRNIENMKHSITGIQPVSHHLRASGVFSPMPVSLQPMNKSLKRRKGVTLFPKDFEDTGRILHIEPINILLTLESTGRWPTTSEAFEAAKTDYLIQLGEALRELEYCIKLSRGYLDVLHGQFIYRLRIKCAKDMTLITPGGKSDTLKQRRLDLEVLPRLHAALDQLYRERPAFGLTCRLVKRWLSCQLLTDHISDITVDLIVAHLFIHPEPYEEPASSLCGMRRFLNLFGRHDWQNQPLVVNFDKQLKLDEISGLRDSMLQERDKYPPIVICTPFEKERGSSPWTQQSPSKQMLNMVCRLCHTATQFLAKDIMSSLDCVDDSKALFRPNFKTFNLLIKLKASLVQNFFMSIDAPKTFTLSGREPSTVRASATKVMPIVDLNLVEKYVIALRGRYDDVASFFYDKYGQRIVGVILKPEAETMLEGGLDEFVAGLKELGSKLVESITLIKEQIK